MPSKNRRNKVLPLPSVGISVSRSQVNQKDPMVWIEIDQEYIMENDSISLDSRYTVLS